MKKLFSNLIKLLLAMLLPWVIYLLLDSPIKALFALAFQMSVIGWIPTSIMAYIAYNKIQDKHKK